MKQIIHNRRAEAMIKAAKQAGKEIAKCEICSRAYLLERGHRCFITAWSSKVQSAKLPSTSNIIISQDGNHEIKISRRTMVDSEKIRREYEKLKQYRTMVSGKDIKENTHSLARIPPVDMEQVPLPSTPITCAVPDLPLMDEKMEEQDINTVSVETTQLYHLIKKAIWEVCDSHFRDGVPLQNAK